MILCGPIRTLRKVFGIIAFNRVGNWEISSHPSLPQPPFIPGEPGERQKLGPESRLFFFPELLLASKLLVGAICKITAPLANPFSLPAINDTQASVFNERRVINIQRKKETLVTILIYTTNNELNLLCGRQRGSIPN